MMYIIIVFKKKKITYCNSYNCCSCRRKNEPEAIHRVFVMAAMEKVMECVSPVIILYIIDKCNFKSLALG